MPVKNTLYFCDPNKNKECKKISCQHYCKLTTKEKCAKLNKSGKPIIYFQAKK